MGRKTMVRMLANERGVALPMALITLVLLTTLMLAFAVLSQTEPVIAANQLRVSQARAHAESGFEYAVWALAAGNVTTPPSGTIANPMPSSPAPAPFDGNVFKSNGITGGFLVTVTNDTAIPADPDVRVITAIGWTPTNSLTDAHTKAHRMIQAKVTGIPNIAGRAPCALCVKGELNVGGAAAINGTNNDPECGANNKYGTFTEGQTVTQGTPSITGGAGGIAQNQGSAAFNNFLFKTPTLDALKMLAKRNGTYFGPGFSGLTDPQGKAVAGTYTGGVSFSSSNKVADGVVFIDTLNGENIDPSGGDTSNMANVEIHGNPFIATDFTGYLVVNGSLQISGNMQINGLVYAVNDFTYDGTGSGAINGLAVSANIRDTSATTIDSDSTGNSRVNFNCANVKSPPFLGHGFYLVPGTYRELSD